MNNFLDTDKVAVPFWGFTAIIVMIDLRSRKQKSDEQQKKIRTHDPDLKYLEN
jgi:putative inorganic carbon (hco3(-)) transporter